MTNVACDTGTLSDADGNSGEMGTTMHRFPFLQYAPDYVSQRADEDVKNLLKVSSQLEN